MVQGFQDENVRGLQRLLDQDYFVSLPEKGSESIDWREVNSEWPTRTVLIAGATVKWNRAKGYPKARTHTVVIDARMLHRWLQANASVDTRVASKDLEGGDLISLSLPHNT